VLELITMGSSSLHLRFAGSEAECPRHASQKIGRNRALRATRSYLLMLPFTGNAAAQLVNAPWHCRGLSESLLYETLFIIHFLFRSCILPLQIRGLCIPRCFSLELLIEFGRFGDPSIQDQSECKSFFTPIVRCTRGEALNSARAWAFSPWVR